MQTSLLTSRPYGGDAASNAGSAFGGATSEAAQLFTRLLVAQIQHQNPLEPNDPSEFVNQLTQLSQMESMQALTRQSAASASMLESMQVIALGAQVGSEVRVRSSRVEIGGDPVHGAFTLENASVQTSLTLIDADGVERAVVVLGTRQPGEVSFTIDPVALGLAPGAYSLEVVTDSGESPHTEIAGRLDSVRLSSTGGVVLQVSHVGLAAPESVTQFNGRPDAAPL